MPCSRLILLTLFATLTSLPADAGAESADAQQMAGHLLRLSGVQGGLIVHLGCGGGELTAALRADQRYTVQGLARDPDQVRVARRHIAAQGLYGPVSVIRLVGSRLPYVDNLVNLVVVQQSGDISREEIMRVLAPHGVACVEHNGRWVVTAKSWPDALDQWTHFLHDSTNNAVAHDSRVGPPRSLQWVAPPLWLRSHETPSGIQSPVSARGRLFYFLDEGLIGIVDQRLPERWSLVCRDAFNGKRLWTRPVASWGWPAWNRQKYENQDLTLLRGTRTDVPAENNRRLVAEGDRVYATLGFRQPLSILDAATGETLVRVAETAGTREILVHSGIAIAYVQDISSDAARRRGLADQIRAALVAVDGATGQVLWKQPCDVIPPLALAVDGQRIIYASGRHLTARDLRTGGQLWQSPSKVANPRTLVCAEGVIVMQTARTVVAHDAATGEQLWQKTVSPISGQEADDLFVIDSLVWRGMTSVDDQLLPQAKSPHALAIGWDLRSGQEKKRIVVRNLRSPEHHHRCYRNKATQRYIISSMEGAEFLDLLGDGHSQDNWLRGACRSGMMPCNGMLYVPPDQCFCEPGAKLLGYAAVTAGPSSPPTVADPSARLERGPAYATEVSAPDPEITDWPTLRYDAARRGATPGQVSASLAVRWQVPLAGPLTAPVMAHGRLFVVQMDAHTLHALDAVTGGPVWQFTAGGRIDSPPTIYRGLVLFGARDGYVYSLRASDGALVWRFLAAPQDQRIASFDQFESSWPVHGSVLVDGGVAYCAAGRSSYLDGGIQLYGLDPATGDPRYQTRLTGPYPPVGDRRDVSFYVLGANADVLVAEGGHIYMRQKKWTPALEEITVPVLSSKGAQDVGRHVFSTSGLLDGSWYNRTFWMYSGRWPGFQLANQAPKSGQLLVVDDERTYAVRVFYRRNVHSPMFFPGKEGYLLFADANDNEPQIVGEAGARAPVAWLPQSDYSRARADEVRTLGSESFGLDKMIGYTRAEPPLWTRWLPVRIRAMVKAGGRLFVAGPPDRLECADPYASFEGRCGAQLVTVEASSGEIAGEMALGSPPVFDGLIAAAGCLYASLEDGHVVCLGDASK